MLAVLKNVDDRNKILDNSLGSYLKLYRVPSILLTWTNPVKFSPQTSPQGTGSLLQESDYQHPKTPML